MADTNAPADELPWAFSDPHAAKLRVLKAGVLLDGFAVASARLKEFPGTVTNIFVVLTVQGQRRLAQLTAANIGRRLAIIWDGRVPLTRRSKRR